MSNILKKIKDIGWSVEEDEEEKNQLSKQNGLKTIKIISNSMGEIWKHFYQKQK